MNQAEILELLKTKRKEIAERESKQLFMIFHNSTLEETAGIMPKTEDDLKKIKGWGGRKVEKYGKEILSLINNAGKSDKIDSYIKGGNILVKAAKTKSENDILSVAEFLRLINRAVYQLGVVKVQGEISDAEQRGRYAFFNLKDSSGNDYGVNCFLGGESYKLSSHLLDEGLEVVIYGRPSVYKNGKFSVQVSRIEPIGEGALRKAFDALKKKLEAKGYFREERKRLLPQFIRHIGLITSESGAAITDFRKNLGELGFKISFIDARVEGDFAEESITGAIEIFNKSCLNLDILVLIRGGGGLENLKAFNSEKVAGAIVSSRLPIITGIGHEKDETIAGYAADKNFSTPTATAVFIKNGRENIIAGVEIYFDNMVSLMDGILESKKDLIDYKTKDLETVFANIISRCQFTLSKLAERAHNGLNKVFNEFKVLEYNFLRAAHRQENIIKNKLYRIDILDQKCFSITEGRYNDSQKRLKIAEVVLLALNPESILRKGYSITYTKDRKVLKEPKYIKTGEKIFTKLYKGKITSRVEEVEN